MQKSSDQLKCLEESFFSRFIHFTLVFCQFSLSIFPSHVSVWVPQVSDPNGLLRRDMGALGGVVVKTVACHHCRDQLRVQIMSRDTLCM